MNYERLVESYARLEATTKRLEMTAILVDMLREAERDELRAVVYLTQGQIAPEFAGVELGLAEKLVQRALAEGWNVPLDRVEQLYRKSGDLGEAAEEVLAKGGARRKTTLEAFSGEAPAEEAPPSVLDVHRTFCEIAAASGPGSQDRKKTLLAGLLARFPKNPAAAKYVVRTVTGKLRLGVADLTLLDALLRAYVLPPDVALSLADLEEDAKGRVREAKALLENAYNVSSDLGRVAEAAAAGPEALARIRLEVGVPVRAMLAERLPTSEEILDKMGGRAAVEWKYDGLRVQAHRGPNGKIRFFSRRLEDVTDQFPDVAAALAEAWKGRQDGSFIVEGEVVAVDRESGEIRPFQEVALRRGRKHGIEAVAEEVPVTVFLFDLLLEDGEDVMARPLTERRARLAAAFATGRRVALSTQEVVDSVEALDAFFESAVTEGAEGVMVKGLDSPYRAGARGFQWIKFKRDYQSRVEDTVDLVVVGTFAGRGRRAGWPGALLMAAYDPERDVFETVCKLGTGFDDATLQALPGRLGPPHDGPHPRVRSQLQADTWYPPTHVLEVRAFEISLSPTHTAGQGLVKEGAGFALRFPRFTGRFRDDKAAEDATTVEELATMYRAQGARPTPTPADDP